MCAEKAVEGRRTAPRRWRVRGAKRNVRSVGIGCKCKAHWHSRRRCKFTKQHTTQNTGYGAGACQWLAKANEDGAHGGSGRWLSALAQPRSECVSKRRRVNQCTQVFLIRQLEGGIVFVEPAHRQFERAPRTEAGGAGIGMRQRLGFGGGFANIRPLRTEEGEV